MEIYIFSAGRADRSLQHTFNILTAAMVPGVQLVVQAREYELYEREETYPLLCLPPHIPDTLPAARAHIAKISKSAKILMLDDDLTFAERRRDDRTKFVKASGASIKKMLDTIEKKLDKYAHVGLCSREGGNRILVDQEATRMSRVLAYNMALVPKDVQFDRVLLPEDFDVTLQLLYHGLPNLVLAGWCHNQPGSNTEGGCSVYRSIAVHNEWMERFGRLHPDVVKIVEKQTKTSWSGLPRLDARIQWKKAYVMGGGDV